MYKVDQLVGFTQQVHINVQLYGLTNSGQEVALTPVNGTWTTHSRRITCRQDSNQLTIDNGGFCDPIVILRQPVISYPNYRIKFQMKKAEPRLTHFYRSILIFLVMRIILNYSSLM